MTYPMHYTDNANSWRRLRMIWSLYRPMLLPAFTWYAVITFVLVMIMGFSTWLKGSFPEFFTTGMLSLMLYCSPVILTRRDYRPVSSQLPVTVAEKLGFLLLLFCIVVPVVMFIGALFGELLCYPLFGEATMAKLNALVEEYDIYNSLPFGIISFIGTVIIVIYYNVTSRNRVLATFISYFTIQAITGFIGGICGLVIGFKEGMINIDHDERAMTEALTPMITYITTATAILIEIAAIIYAVKLYKYLRNSGF